MKTVLRWFTSIICLAICVLYVPADPKSDPVAGDAYDLGRAVQRTPFDFKLTLAGFFYENSTSAFHTSSSQTVEQLFRMARSFRYASGKIYENKWQSAKETGAKHSGICIDKALWLYAQLKKNGYRHVRLVIGKYRSIDPLLHAWVVYVNESGDTYLLDSSMQNRPWELREFSEGLYQPLYSFDDKNGSIEFNRRL